MTELQVQSCLCVLLFFGPCSCPRCEVDAVFSALVKTQLAAHQLTGSALQIFNEPNIDASVLGDSDVFSNGADACAPYLQVPRQSFMILQNKMGICVIYHEGLCSAQMHVCLPCHADAFTLSRALTILKAARTRCKLGNP